MIGISPQKMRTISSQADKVNSCLHKTVKKSQPGRIVIVEGNIGVGKTTLTCQLGRKLNYRIFLEPASGNPYLSKFYEDPKKYALKMQLWLFRQRCSMYMKAVKHWVHSGEGVILDRSLFSDNVFAVVNYSDGFISNEGYQQYCNLRKQVLNLVPFPHIAIFLSVNPEECYNRITRRGRDCENGIPLSYLSSLESGYQDLLNEMRIHDCEVTLYDWSQYGYPFEVDKDIRNANCAERYLDEESFELINKKINKLFRANVLSESDIEEIDDCELNSEEMRAHANETKLSKSNCTKI